MLEPALTSVSLWSRYSKDRPENDRKSALGRLGRSSFVGSATNLNA